MDNLSKKIVKLVEPFIRKWEKLPLKQQRIHLIFGMFFTTIGVALWLYFSANFLALSPPRNVVTKVENKEIIFQRKRLNLLKDSLYLEVKKIQLKAKENKKLN